MTAVFVVLTFQVHLSKEIVKSGIATQRIEQRIRRKAVDEPSDTDNLIKQGKGRVDFSHVRQYIRAGYRGPAHAGAKLESLAMAALNSAATRAR